MKKIDVFKPEMFKATKFDTEKDKAEFANKLVVFIERGFPKKLWTRQIYSKLCNMFGHIANYNLEGFYENWFGDASRKRLFLDNILGWPGYGSPLHTYSDVELRIKEWLRSTHWLRIAGERQIQEIDDRNYKEYQRLKAKFGTECTRCRAMGAM